MNLLIAVHGFPPTHSAGAERQAERMAKWMVRHGHTVHVLAVESVQTPGLHVETTLQEDINIHRISYNLNELPDSFRGSYDNPAIGHLLRELLQREHVDLVHLISGYLLGGQITLTARELGVPVVVSPMEYWFLCARLNLIQATGALCTGPESDQKCARCLIEDKRRFRLATQVVPMLSNTIWRAAFAVNLADNRTEALAARRITLRRALEAADLVICNSHFLISKFSEFGFNTSRFVFIRQGLADAPVRRDATNDSSKRLRLGYIGQIKYHKGVDLIINAVTALCQQGNNVTLDVWGNETEEPLYVARLKKASCVHNAVRWNGRYVGAQVVEVLNSIDVLVVPSRWYENSPNVILEAFSAGIPVIATNLGGMAEIVQHGQNGLLFELNNPADLATQIRRLLTEPGLLSQLRTGIPEIKKIDEEMQETFDLYQKLLKEWD